jgi:hypothetical protein
MAAETTQPRSIHWGLFVGLALGSLLFVLPFVNAALMTSQLGEYRLGIPIHYLMFVIGFLCYAVLYVYIVVETGLIARSFGQSRAAFTIFAIFLPFIALIVVLIMQSNSLNKAQTPSVA